MVAARLRILLLRLPTTLINRTPLMTLKILNSLNNLKAGIIREIIVSTFLLMKSSFRGAMINLIRKSSMNINQIPILIFSKSGVKPLINSTMMRINHTNPRKVIGPSSNRSMDFRRLHRSFSICCFMRSKQYSKAKGAQSCVVKDHIVLLFPVTTFSFFFYLRVNPNDNSSIFSFPGLLVATSHPLSA